MHDSFLIFSRFRYLKWAIVLTLICVFGYIHYEPVDLPNGGSLMGYALGVVAALMIVVLMAFGIRKRAYRSQLGTVQGWLSAHVYFGLALAIIATLHTGFQFGWNVHTLAYGLMMVVIISGIIGVVLYRICPQLMSEVLRESSIRELREEISDASAAIMRVADTLGGEIHAQALYALQHADEPRSSLSMRTTLSTATASSAFDELREKLHVELARAGGAERATSLRALISQLGHRDQAARRLRREADLKRLLELWLFFHVPLSVALVAALISHVISVFAYW